MYYEVTYSLQTRKYCDVLNEDKGYPFTTQCMELIVAQIQTLWGGYLSSKQPPDAAGNASGYTEFPWQDSLDLYRVSRCVMSQEESIRQRELGSLVPRVLEGELGGESGSESGDQAGGWRKGWAWVGSWHGLTFGARVRVEPPSITNGGWHLERYIDSPHPQIESNASSKNTNEQNRTLWSMLRPEIYWRMSYRFFPHSTHALVSRVVAG